MFENVASWLTASPFWVLTYFGILAGCVWLWGDGSGDDGVGFESSDGD